MEYYNYKGNVKKIIEEYFEEDILNEENYIGSSKIRSTISEFTNRKFDWSDRTIFKDLLNEFGDFNFDNQTHFYNNDRCLQFYAEKEQNNYTISYKIGVSIFNFFSINQSNFVKNKENRYEYEPLKYFDRGEEPFADKIFEIVRQYYPDIKWLPKKLLITPIKNLNIFSDKLRKDITVVDLIFTQNR